MSRPRGGARPGSGRPALEGGAVVLGDRLPRPLVERLTAMARTLDVPRAELVRVYVEAGLRRDEGADAAKGG